MSPLTEIDQPKASQPKASQPKASQPKAQAKSWRERTSSSRVGTILVLVVTAALVVLGSYLVDRPEMAEDGVTPIKLMQEGRGAAPKIGSPAQDFTATTVDGKDVSLSSYKGKAVWLTFGATWCAPCQAEAPDIQALSEKNKANAVVLSIFISEDSATVRDYGDRIGLTFPKIADSDTQVASAYRVKGIPVHFFIDRSGILRTQVTGSMTPERMDAELAKVIG